MLNAHYSHEELNERSRVIGGHMQEELERKEELKEPLSPETERIL